MKQEPRGRLLLYVSFTEERCGLMIEQQMLSVKLVFIHHQGMHFIVCFGFTWMPDMLFLDWSLRGYYLYLNSSGL